MALRVLLLYKVMIPSVVLCGYLQLKRLSERGDVEFKHSSTDALKEDDLNWANVVLLVRGDSPLEVWIAQQCRRTGRYVIYVLDDDLLHMPPQLSSSDFYHSETVQASIHKLLELANCFAAPSLRLLEKYGVGMEKTFQLVEPSAFVMKEKRHREEEVIYIGFAGSVDRGGDIDRLLAGALCQIKEKYGQGVRIELFGPQTETARKVGAKTYPYLDSYQAYQEMMAQLNWDIGLAPMPCSEFHRCKHYNKLVEYCGFGIAGVYSREEPYLGVVKDGVNGLLCKNTTQAWVDAISRLIEDTALRQFISQTCLEQARDRFSVEQAANAFGDFLAPWAAAGKEEEQASVQGLAVSRCRKKFGYRCQRIREYGWRAPAVILRKVIKKLKKE